MIRGESQPGFLSAEAFGHPVHNVDKDLDTVRQALLDSGLTTEQTENAVTAMQSAGVVFQIEGAR